MRNKAIFPVEVRISRLKFNEIENKLFKIRFQNR